MAGPTFTTSVKSLSQQDAAYLLSVTSRTLRDWPDVPRNEDGTYDGAAVVRYLVSRYERDGNFDDQRERLAAAQAEKVETENAVRRKELAVVGDVIAVWTDHIIAARAKLLSLPSKLAPTLTNLDDPNLIAASIRAEVNAALHELADHEPAQVEPRGNESRVEGMGATA